MVEFMKRKISFARINAMRLHPADGEQVASFGFEICFEGERGHPEGPTILITAAVPATDATTFRDCEDAALGYVHGLLAMAAALDSAELRSAFDASLTREDRQDS